MRGKRMLAQAIVALAIAVLVGCRAIAAGPATPIQHVVVIYHDNVSFDHHFGTYPLASNTGATGEPIFQADPATPSVNGLMAAGLLTRNPNGSNPFRLTRAQAATCDQDHDYTDEEAMFNLEILVGGSNAECARYFSDETDLDIGTA
jgi:phospholipase C